MKSIFIIMLLLTSAQVIAGDIRVAVASNFANAITAIAERFEANTGHKVNLIFGSTGKHYAQIKNGAPFDIFFAADTRRPELLEQEGEGLPGTRLTYATGKLVLWSPQPGFVDADGAVLSQKQYRYLAIANPKLAPYGRAAEEVLQSQGLWTELQEHLVRGENIGQAFQFVKSGNAQLGLVAYSQLKRPGQIIEGSFWEVPQVFYSPVRQQVILLQDKPAARVFLSFIQSPEVLKILEEYGYDSP